MGLQLPKRARRTGNRLVVAVVLGVSLLMLGACSADDNAQVKRWAMPEPATNEAPHIYDLWKWSWVAALVTGIIVWALIFYVSWRYRRRSDADVPVQTRYNLPLEIFYTIAPIMMVIVFFYWTVSVEHDVLKVDEENTDHVIEVVGQQWSWTFNYTNEDAVEANNVYTAGTASQIPTLVLPVDESVRVNLSSPDVIHSFWVPSFLMKMDVVPGRDNNFAFTPNRIGTFKGKCAELCGVYHSRMLFNVNVVSAEDYDAYLQELEAKGYASDEPLKGGEDADTQFGLDPKKDNGGTE